jgi:hypothetical protein
MRNHDCPGCCKGVVADYLGFDDLLTLDLTEDEAQAVLAGQPQVHRDEVEDRLTLYRQEQDRRRSR